MIKKFNRQYIESFGWKYIDSSNYIFEIEKNKEGFEIKIIDGDLLQVYEYFKDDEREKEVFLVDNIWVSDIPWMDRLMRRLLIANFNNENFRITKNSFINDYNWVLQKIPQHLHNSVSDYKNYRIIKNYNFYREQENTISIIQYLDTSKIKYKTLFFGIINSEKEFEDLLKQIKIK